LFNCNINYTLHPQNNVAKTTKTPPSTFIIIMKTVPLRCDAMLFLFTMQCCFGLSRNRAQPIMHSKRPAFCVHCLSTPTFARTLFLYTEILLANKRNVCRPIRNSLPTINYKYFFNHLIATLKPQSNRPSYSNTVIGTLAVDGWAVTFGTAHPSTASVPISYYSMWHCNCLCLKG